jgi:hypothetical protein
VSQESTNRSFDDLARALAEGSISRRGALKLFAGSAIAALIPSRALAQQQKVTICHKPGTPDEKTKEVPKSAVDSHLDHGDHRGPCGTTTTTSTSTTSTSTSTSSTTSTSTTTPTSPTSTSTTTPTTSTSTTPMCLQNGGNCSVDTQCCSGICNRTGFCGFCRFESGSCNANTACCGGICENGTCCVGAGSQCTTNEGCCGDLTCGPLRTCVL